MEKKKKDPSMTKSEYLDWCNNHVTKELVKKIKDNLLYAKEAINNVVINNKNVDVEELNRLKGSIITLLGMIDTEYEDRIAMDLFDITTKGDEEDDTNE